MNMLGHIFFPVLFLFGLAEIRACLDLRNHFDSSVLIVDFEVVYRCELGASSCCFNRSFAC